MEYKDLLGGKGANLAEMTSVLKLPVPPGFTISTDACRAYMRAGWPAGLTDEITKHIAKLEKTMGRKLGDPSDPLLVSVRSGAKFSMPGMMDTVLNLGLNDKSVKGLAKVTDDERFAYDSYRRFIAMYGRIVLDVDGELFDHPLEEAKRRTKVKTDAELTAAELKQLCELYKQVVKSHTGKPFPQQPMQQLRGAVEAVFRSWNGARAIAYRVRERISHDLGTAVNVQVMVFGNRDDNSGTGVGFTRNAATGENRPYGDFLIKAQGEDVVAGIRNTEDLDALATHFPTIHDELFAIFERLERHYRDMCDTEFTIEQGKLWMLQTRVGKRTGAAALEDGRRHDEGHRAWRREVEDHQARSRDAGRRGPPRLGAAPAVRGPGQGARQGPRGVAGSCRRQGVLHRRRRGRCFRPRREGHPRAQRDEPRGRPRHDGRRGHPHGTRRPRQPRRRRGPWLGDACRRGRRRDQDLGQAVLRRRHHRRRGRRDLGRRHER